MVVMTMQYTRNLTTKGEDGKLSVVTGQFKTTILVAGNVQRHDTEPLEMYGERMDTLVKAIDAELAGWSGRNEHFSDADVESLVTKVTGFAAALNMGLDLAHRQFEKPKKMTATQIIVHNRTLAMAWAWNEVSKPDGKVTLDAMKVAMTTGKGDAFLDGLLSQYRIEGTK